MSIPALQITDHSLTLANGANNSLPDKYAMTSTTTRKSLHQNIFGKLRPLPFQYHWTVWYDKNNTTNTATTDNNKKKNLLYILHEDVADIATFYRVYNNYPWDKVRVRDSVHIFRQGVEPVWEDPQNQNGGCWQFRVPKSKAQAVFHELAILCMANEFQAVLEKEHDHVLGISSTVRLTSHLISVWNKQGSNERSIRILERTILDRLSPDLRPSGSHADAYCYRRHADNEGFQEAVDALSARG